MSLRVGQMLCTIAYLLITCLGGLLLNYRTITWAAEGVAQSKSNSIRCDGITDNAPIVQAMVSDRPGKKIVFPPGICFMGSSINITQLNSVLEGQGVGITVLLFSQHPGLVGANITFTAADPRVGYQQSYISGAIRHLTISSGLMAAENGAGLQVVQGKAFEIEDIAIVNAFIGLDLVGGSDVHVSNLRISTGGGWATAKPGSRCMRLRGQPLEGGGVWPASNIYFFSINCYGIENYTEDGIEITGADTLMFSNLYVCCTARNNIRIEADRVDKGGYVASIAFVGGFLDGNPEGQIGLLVPFQPSAPRAKYFDISLTGMQVSNFRKYGVRLEAPTLLRFSSTGSHFSNNSMSSLYIRSVGTATLAGNSFTGGSWSIQLGTPSSIVGSLAIVGNVWDSSAAGDGHAIIQDGAGGVTGSISIVGNAFGSYRAPVVWRGVPPRTYAFAANSGEHVGPNILGPLKLMGGLTLPVSDVYGDTTLTYSQSVIMLRADKPITVTLPPADESRGLTYTMKNISRTRHRVSDYIDSSGNKIDVIEAGAVIQLISDGESWQAY